MLHSKYFFKKVVLFFILILFGFNCSRTFDYINFEPVSLASAPVSLAVLYANAKSKDKLADKLKLLESFLSLVNEFKYHNKLSFHLDVSQSIWFDFEALRFIKYFKKYLDERKKNQPKFIVSDKKLTENAKKLMLDFSLTEQELQEIFKDEDFLYDKILKQL